MATKGIAPLDEADQRMNSGPTERRRSSPNGAREEEKPLHGVAHSREKERGKSIAVVEDAQDLLSAYTAVFRRLGWSPVTALETGEEMVRAAADGSINPNVVIVDYRLSGMHGLETARRLRMALPQAKIVMTTADDRVRDEAESSGFLFLQKPFAISTLVEFLSRI